VYRAIRDLRIAMSNKAIKRKAAEHLGNGLPKQYAYDLLLAEYPEAKPKKVAEVLRYMPTQQARERFRDMHLLLLGLIAASALLRILRPVLQDAIRWDMATAYLSLVPIASLLLGYSIYRWQGQVYEWVGWGNVVGAFGLLSALRSFDMHNVDLWALSMKLFAVAIGVVSLYLARKVFSKPKMEKDPLEKGVVRVVFPEEGMG